MERRRKLLRWIRVGGVGAVAAVGTWILLGCPTGGGPSVLYPGFPNATTASAFRGARLFDDWRFYNTATGTGGLPSATRCRECHGWQGDEVPTVNLVTEAAEHTVVELATTIRDGVTGTAMPAFSGIFVANFNPDQQFVDLAAFLKEQLRQFPLTGGTVNAGQTVYDVARCEMCHGPDGRAIDFHADGRQPPDLPEYLGAAIANPDEFAHRIQYNHPRPDDQQRAIWGSAMEAWRQPPADGGINITEQQVRDLIALLSTLPTAPL